ncbi:unnamed protein product [Acidithrix sp. C25]|nr:unnamed protein product [Acidithrix sp. C25]
MNNFLKFYTNTGHRFLDRWKEIASGAMALFTKWRRDEERIILLVFSSYNN